MISISAFVPENVTTNVSTTANQTSLSPTPPPCAARSSCDDQDIKISSVIFAVSLVAFLENFALIVAMHKWKLVKSCKMFWFLWHLSVADAIVAVSFAYFHIRVLTACPIPHSCTPGYHAESLVLLMLFFSTIVASHLFVLAATMDRFIAIKWPLRYTQFVTTRSSRVLASFIWIVALLVPLLGAIGIQFWKTELSYSIIILVCAITCLSAAACVIILNSWMVHYARKSIRNRPSISSAATVSRISTTSSFPDLSSFQENVKPTVTLALFVASFILSCAPWSVALIVCKEAHRCKVKQNQDYTLVLVLFHAVVIPILYGFRVEVVKLHVLSFWRRYLPQRFLSCRTGCCWSTA